MPLSAAATACAGHRSVEPGRGPSRQLTGHRLPAGCSRCCQCVMLDCCQHPARLPGAVSQLLHLHRCQRHVRLRPSSGASNARSAAGRLLTAGTPPKAPQAISARLVRRLTVQDKQVMMFLPQCDYDRLLWPNCRPLLDAHLLLWARTQPHPMVCDTPARRRPHILHARQPPDQHGLRAHQARMRCY